MFKRKKSETKIDDRVQVSEKKKLKDFVHLEEYVAESVVIPKREIENYIKGRCIPILGDNFYYTYTYKNGVLLFIAGKSKNFVKGKFPVLSVVFMGEGDYYLKDKNKEFYHYFISKGNEIQHVITYKKPESGVEINEDLLLSVGKIPKQLRLRWSLDNKSYLSIGLVVFFVGLLTYFFVLNEAYNKKDLILKNRQNQLMSQVNVSTSAKISLADLLNKVEKSIEDGKILKIYQSDKKFVVEVYFDKEMSAQKFLEMHGGTYENNKVVFSLDFSM